MDKITRENHLDHMVRVVPFIVTGYALQCFMILQVSPGEFTQISLSVLGGFIAAMIAGFITYDLKHSADFNPSGISIQFFSGTKFIRYSEILKVEVSDPGQTFATVKIFTAKGQARLRFVDRPDAVKAHIDQRRSPATQAAA